MISVFFNSIWGTGSLSTWHKHARAQSLHPHQRSHTLILVHTCTATKKPYADKIFIMTISPLLASCTQLRGDTRWWHVLVHSAGFDRPSHLAASVSGVKPSQLRISSASGPSRRVISQSTTSCAARSSAPSPVPPSSSRPPPPPPASRSRQNSEL